MKTMLKNSNKKPLFWTWNQNSVFLQALEYLELFGNKHKMTSGKTQQLQIMIKCVYFPARCKSV